MSRIDDLKQEQEFNAGAFRFYKAHRDVAPLEANTAILSAEIRKKGLPPTELKSWETAYESVKSSLASPAKEAPISEPEPEKWNYPFPEIHTVADIKRLDGKIYNDFWFDKDRRTGLPSEKSLQFRAVVQAIVDRENAQRSQQ